MDNIEKPEQKQLKQYKEHFEYKMVAFVSIIKGNQGPVNLGTKNKKGKEDHNI